MVELIMVLGRIEVREVNGDDQNFVVGGQLFDENDPRHILLQAALTAQYQRLRNHEAAEAARRAEKKAKEKALSTRSK